VQLLLLLHPWLLLSGQAQLWQHRCLLLGSAAEGSCCAAPVAAHPGLQKAEQSKLVLRSGWRCVKNPHGSCMKGSCTAEQYAQRLQQAGPSTDSTGIAPALVPHPAPADTAALTCVCTSYACDPILLPRQYLRPPSSCCLCPGPRRVIHACLITDRVEGTSMRVSNRQTDAELSGTQLNSSRSQPMWFLSSLQPQCVLK
jgi:hypothetical protein